MINHIVGKLVEKTPTYAVIECSGVGYFINISLNTFSKIGDAEQCKLYTHMVVREDAHLLFGFFDAHEKEIFLKLISVSGVGASTARMILSSLSPSEVEEAIETANVSLLKGIKGIGEKSAQRIIVDLKGKLGKALSVFLNVLEKHNKTKEEALLALVNLGFAKNMAEKTLEKIVRANPENTTVELLIKESLKVL